MSNVFTALRPFCGKGFVRSIKPTLFRGLSLALSLVLTVPTLAAPQQNTGKNAGKMAQAKDEQNQSPTPTSTPTPTPTPALRVTKSSSSLALSDLVERALFVAIKDVITNQFDGEISKEVNELEKTTKNVDRSNPKNDIFLDYLIEHLAGELYQKYSKEIIAKTAELSRGSLSLWSRQVHQQSPSKYSTELSFFNQYGPGLNASLNDLAGIDLADFGSASSARLMNLIKGQIRNWILLKSSKVSGVLANSERSRTADGKSQGRVVEGSSANMVIDGLGEGITPVELTIPSVPLERLIAESPEVLRMQKTVAFAKDFSAQSVLFNLPLYWITLAHVGMDYARNPMAITQFFDSLKDPATNVGFAAFIAANHRFSRMWLNMANPRFHFLGPQLGMAMGMTASSFVSGLWHDPFVQACAKSHLKDREACQKAYNGWVLTGKINELTPGIAGLLGTAMLSGFISKGVATGTGMAINGAMNGLGAVKNKTMNKVASKYGVQLAGLHILPKKLFTPAQLEQYLVHLRKVKGLVNTSVITLGTNLVFLAVDPFVSPLVSGGWQKMEKTSFDLSQFLELTSPLGNLENMGRFMMFDNVKLPHEIEVKTLEQSFNALNTSMQSFLNDNFEAMDPKLCVNAQGKQLLDVALPNNWYGTSNSNYLALRDCLLKADTPFWLQKYAETQKDWRTYLIRETQNASLQWSATIGDFLTMFNGTRQFYDYVIRGIWEHRRFAIEIEAGKGSAAEKAQKIAEHREELLMRLMRRSALLKVSVDATQVPATVAHVESVTEDGKMVRKVSIPGRSEEEKAKFAELYPSHMGNFQVTELSDYLLTSMVCGPRAEDKASAFQKFASLRLLPWESIAKVLPSAFTTTKITEPFSPVLDTAPGLRFEFLPPRITEKNEVCDKANWMKVDTKLQATIEKGSAVEASPILRTLDQWFPGFAGKAEKFKDNVVEATSDLNRSVVSHLTDEVRTNRYSDKARQFGAWFVDNGTEIYKDQSALIYWQPIKVGGKTYRGVLDYLIDNAREDVLRSSDEFDNGFVDWYRKVVEDPIASEDSGLWKDFKLNYQNLLDQHFYPALVNNDFDKGCENGKITCADHKDIYIQASGAVNSALVELQTYRRNLEKILTKLGAKSTDPEIIELRNKQEKILGSLSVLRERDGIRDFNFEVLKKDMEAYKTAFPQVVSGLVSAQHQASSGAAAVMANGKDEVTQKAIFAVSGRIFELMSNVLAELESYKGYLETLDLNKTSGATAGDNKGGANAINPMVRF